MKYNLLSAVLLLNFICPCVCDNWKPTPYPGWPPRESERVARNFGRPPINAARRPWINNFTMASRLSTWLCVSVVLSWMAVQRTFADDPQLSPNPQPAQPVQPPPKP